MQSNWYLFIRTLMVEMTHFMYHHLPWHTTRAANGRTLAKECDTLNQYDLLNWSFLLFTCFFFLPQFTPVQGQRQLIARSVTVDEEISNQITLATIKIVNKQFTSLWWHFVYQLLNYSSTTIATRWFTFLICNRVKVSIIGDCKVHKSTVWSVAWWTEGK